MIYDLEKVFPKNTEKYIKDFLNNPRVREALKPLACYKDTVKNLLLTPRHGSLRPYIDIILETLSSIQCVNPERIGGIIRQPIYIIEREEKVEAKRKTYKPMFYYKEYYPRRVLKKRNIIRNLAIIAVLFIIIAMGAYFATQLRPEEVSTTSSQTSFPHAYTPYSHSPYMPTSQYQVGRINVTEFILYALNQINSEREKHGLKPLSLFINNTVAQQHAEEMASYEYLSHWNLKGYKPYMRWGFEGFTWFGISESLGATFIEDGIVWTQGKLLETIRDNIYSMVYNDAESNWGHRDDLLDPCHNYVAIGIAFSEKMFGLVINSIDNYILWYEKPRILDSKLYMSGIIPYRFINKSDIVPINIYVYYDEIPKETSVYELNYVFPSAWGYGEANKPIAGILPKSNIHYENIKTVYAEKYITRNTEKGLFFKITVNLKPILNKEGIYTIIVLQEDLEQKHPYRKINYCTLTNIVIKYENEILIYKNPKEP